MRAAAPRRPTCNIFVEEGLARKLNLTTTHPREFFTRPLYLAIDWKGRGLETKGPPCVNSWNTPRYISRSRIFSWLNGLCCLFLALLSTSDCSSIGYCIYSLQYSDVMAYVELCNNMCSGLKVIDYILWILWDRLAATAARACSASDWQTAYQSLVSAEV